MAYLKSKTKSWQGTFFDMCDEHYAIVFWVKYFTNMSFDINVVSQIELGKHKEKKRARNPEDGE